MFLNKKPDNLMTKEAEWDKKKTIKLDNFKILSKIKEEKAWWIKRKLDNYKIFSKENLEKPMNLAAN